MQRVLVTPRSLTAAPHPAVEALRDRGFDVVYSTPNVLPDEDELCRLLPGTVGWLAGVEPVSPRAIGAAQALRVVSRNGSGVDNLPLPLLTERGIALCRADGGNAAGVAELAIALALSALRQIPFADAGIKAGEWRRRRGGEIRGRTVGVVGCGAIGGEVARLFSALGASIIAHDPFPRRLEVAEDRLRWSDLATLLREADLVTFHCPSLPGGQPILDRLALASLKPGAVVVNTARAGLVDEAALIEALDEGRLLAYATDVFPEEPPRSLALPGHSRVIATSHIGGFTGESVDRVTEIAVENLVRALQP
ncbi:oxidoreductase [Aureimonas sp. Leaf454]|uniref:NAD(P)-dependent oxidoreductase n=1 Tax=Aureimonas sp. Leaf454 TaxID=1736381 RepID=UPI0006FCA711|nr:NAD(P)-dependent oxidoreductase [Aureimonas sp. Leaf454]KQT43193.1 oxidoreductase [Aureimonas sp. Leaf454]